MATTSDQRIVIVTGAGGHIGRAVCRLLKANESNLLAVDVDADAADGVVACDLRSQANVSRLFAGGPVRVVIHLAAILPSAFQRDPFAGVDVNLTACFELLGQAVKAGVKRFVFASSMSVYGSLHAGKSATEEDPAAPDNPYGASKLAVEVVGETLARGGQIEFVSLRIARVIGPGIKKTASPWRSEIFERSGGRDVIQIPFAPEARLSLVHAEDVAQMLITLADAPRTRSNIYNTPTEQWEVRHLKEVIEEAGGRRVDLTAGGNHGGPICDGSGFAQEFGFQLRGLRERLSARESGIERR
jgi:nucleoside-diphosphate-sugar epimerase